MKLIIVLFFSFISLQSKAQVNLNSFANRYEVRRISGTTSTIKRPLLSLNTMYSGKSYQKGYDVEFVLNSLALHASTLGSIFTDANSEIFSNPTSTNNIDYNARVLQHQAFRTLITYVRSRNNQPVGNIPGTNISLVFSENDRWDFINALKHPRSFYLVSENAKGVDDYVKWTQSLSNYARAIDLYLAFEMAVMTYEPNKEAQYLLSMAEKKQLLLNISKGMITAYKALTKDIGYITGVNMDEIESGNRPMKMYASLGYASLVIQDVLDAVTQEDNSVIMEFQQYFLLNKYFILNFFNTIKNNSFAYLNPDADKNNRKRYWAYQSDGGKRMWAEGPYYLEYAIREIIPYWHAKRISGEIQAGSANDPFNNPKFTNPLQWLIDIHTPDGNMPPIDDGNKRLIKYGKIMGFAPPYVNTTNSNSIKLGANWKWLNNVVQQNTSSDNNLLLLELAIPQVTGNGEAIEDMIYGEDEQQIVFRYTAPNATKHYVFMNGEKGRSISGGEGHEHPDQLQLLYYIKEPGNSEHSILMGSGYDRGAKYYNSMWNDYQLKNTLWVSDFTNTGGIAAPPEGFGNIAPNLHKTSHHQDVYELTKIKESNDVVGFRGSVFLYNHITTVYKFPYNREILFIKGENPYLIDLNSFHVSSYNVTYEAYGALSVGLSYHTDSDEIQFEKGEINKYLVNHKKPSNKNSYIYITPIEYSNNTTNTFNLNRNMFSREVQGRDGEGFTDDLYRSFFKYQHNFLGKSYESITKGELSDDAISFAKFQQFMDGSSYSLFNSKPFAEQQIGYLTKQIGIYGLNPSAQSWNSISVISSENLHSKISVLKEWDLFDANRKYQVYRINLNDDTKDYVFKRKGQAEQNYSIRYSGKIDVVDEQFPEVSFSVSSSGFGFARYKKIDGFWMLDVENSINIIDNAAFMISQNMILESGQTPSKYKVQKVTDGITVTVNGDANLNGKTFKMGNNSKIRFISGNPDLTNLIIESNTPSDNYYIELGASYPLILSSNEKMIIGGKANLTGYRIQVNQGGELEIKDGSTVTLTDSFQFYNYGTTKIGSGVSMKLKNLTSYSSGNLLINQNGGTQTTLNISANGVINIQGLATVKNTDFIKSGASNFSHVSITGNQAKSFENSHIEGSQYGFLVNNVATSNQTLFKNVSGMNNYYSVIKSTNSSFKINGFEGIGAVQDGLGAYSGSVVSLAGSFVAQNNLLGIRAAYNSAIYYYDVNSTVQIKSNTRGIHLYNDSRVDLYGGELSLWGNNRTDNLYGGVTKYDLYVQNNSDIYVNGFLDEIHNPTSFIEAGSTITIENQNEGGVHKASGEKEEFANSDKHAPSLTKKAFMKAFWNATKAVNKQAVKDVLKDNKANSKQEIRSKAIALEILNLAQAGDFSWVNTFNKRAKLHSFVEDDALLIAEQQFYYATQTQPDEQDAQYWLEQLKAMNHDAVATGLFDVLFEQAEFTKTSGDSDDEKDKKWTSKQTLDIAAYPNPFNPTTSLKFTLKESAMVNIQVYDIMGRFVQTLTNTQWQSGVHTVSFDASKLASGLYFARTQLLQSGVLVDQSITKLMLVK